MRAALCHAYAAENALSVETAESPPMIEQGVRIAVAAAGVNFADTLLVTGQYQEKPPFPFSPGLEISGIVEETAPGVTRVKKGDRVLATPDGGGFAEQVVAREVDVHPIPDSLDFIKAAGFPIAYGTSHAALVWRGSLRSGEVLLVHGAAGGVGLTAVEVGKALGAKIVATAGGAEKLAVAREHGADFLIDYRSEDIRERFKAIAADEGWSGADVIYDPVGGSAFEASLRCAAWEGRILTIGFAGGETPKAPCNILLVKNISVVGVYWGSYRKHRPAALASAFQELFGWFEEGLLKPHVSHVLPLEQANEALALLKSRKSTGKVVIDINAD